ncbi:MAG: hypothetical protein AB9846_00315 [Tenuifilaceae bacterium]
MKKSKLLWILAGILITFNIIIYITQWGGDVVLMYVSDLFPVVCAFITLICLYLAVSGFKQFDYVKKAWLLIFLGIFMYFIAESIYAYLEISVGMDMNETYPSLADFFWCGAYLPLSAGLAMMFISYKKSGLPMGNLMDYVLLSSLFVIMAIVTIFLILIPIIEDTETGVSAKIFYLFYPIADLFLVVPAILLMYVTNLFGKGTISKPWKFLAIGFICFTIADLLYSYLSWDDLYGSGNLIDVAWHAGYLFIGLAGLYQRELIDSINEGTQL